MSPRLEIDHDDREEAQDEPRRRGQGVRAALVDKDRTPRWKPASLAAVGDIAPFFAPLGTRELFS